MISEKTIRSLNEFNAFVNEHNFIDDKWNKKQTSKLYTFSKELLKWNKKIRLTAAKDLDDLTRNHIADALHLLEDLPLDSNSALDVGSGGGLPVIPLAIATPNINWVSIEATAKKSTFLSHIKRECELKNFTALNCRYEDYLSKDIQHDLTVSRAVWSPDVWLEKAKHVTKKSGTILVLEAKTLVTQQKNMVRRNYSINGKNRGIVKVINI